MADRRIEGEHPYLYLERIMMKRGWVREFRNLPRLVATAVNSEGFGQNATAATAWLIRNQDEKFNQP